MKSTESADEGKHQNNTTLATGARVFAAGVAVAATCYAAYAGITWYRYGRVAHPANAEDRDALLDRFMPHYEVAERHHVRIAAPAERAFSAACDMDLEQSAFIRAIFKARELILGGKRQANSRRLGLVAQAKAWGWGVLAEEPGREIVFGAATQPWVANPTFRGLPPDEFERFHEPGYVKIAWTLRVDSIDAAHAVFRTETRVIATDVESRAKFRVYWALLSPGVKLIRRLSLRPLKANAEQGARRAAHIVQGRSSNLAQ